MGGWEFGFYEGYVKCFMGFLVGRGVVFIVYRLIFFWYFILDYLVLYMVVGSNIGRFYMSYFLFF